jgi:hypothetical protein
VTRNQIACDESGCPAIATDSSQTARIRALGVRTWAASRGWAAGGEGIDFCPVHLLGP